MLNQPLLVVGPRLRCRLSGIEPETIVTDRVIRSEENGALVSVQIGTLKRRAEGAEM
jgi:hypothetical protein